MPLLWRVLNKNYNNNHKKTATLCTILNTNKFLVNYTKNNRQKQKNMVV